MPLLFFVKFSFALMKEDKDMLKFLFVVYAIGVVVESILATYAIFYNNREGLLENVVTYIIGAYTLVLIWPAILFARFIVYLRDKKEDH